VAVQQVGQGQAQRQQWLTALIVGGLLLTALAVGLAYWGAARRHPAISHPPPSPPADVNQQLSGYTFTRSDQGRPVFTLHAAQTVSYQGGNSMILEDVKVEIYGRKGDTGDVLRTDRCQYNPQSGDFVAAGPVQVKLSAHSNEIPGSGLRGKHPVDIDTSKVSYIQASKVAETDEPVKFRMGTASGTAKGMAYGMSDGWLELKNNVAIDLAQGTAKSPGQPLHLTASALRYDKVHGTIALSGPVELAQGKNHAIADNAQVLLVGNNRPSCITLEGNAKAFEFTPTRSIELYADRVKGDFDAASGELRHITGEDDVRGESKSRGGTSQFKAERFDLDVKGEQPQPIHGVAKGNVQVEGETEAVIGPGSNSSTSKSQENKSLSASELEFNFRPDTHGLNGADTVGPGTLTISPSDPKSSKKVIQAGQFSMKFDSRSVIESLHGTSPTQITVFAPPSDAKGTPPTISKADLLDATFNPGIGTLRDMKQAGNFQYQDGDRRASSNDAHYDAQAQTVVLHGHPQTWDPNSRVKSQKLSIDLQTNSAVGEGNVQASHQQTPPVGAGANQKAPTPTNVLADKMTANKLSQTIHYEGNVRAWNGTSVLESASLDVYRAQRRLTSKTPVETTFLRSVQGAPGDQPSGRAAPTGPRPVSVHADALDYLDEGRRAQYHGHVKMVTQDITMLSDRLDVYLTPTDNSGGSQVDHAEADGHVKFNEPGRAGTSDHAEYFTGAGKVILTGGPPVLVDEEKGTTTGQRLTFFIHDDRLFVDGGAQSPSLTQHRVAP
jgi:lipopolysaccharide export system protein LptA